MQLLVGVSDQLPSTTSLKEGLQKTANYFKLVDSNNNMEPPSVPFKNIDRHMTLQYHIYNRPQMDPRATFGIVLFMWLSWKRRCIV